MKQKAIITAAIVLMCGGLWWQLKGTPNGSANPEPASPTTDTTPQNQTTNPGEPDGYFDQDDPTNPTTKTDDDDSEQKNLATDDDLERCVPSDGFGIVMKDWGNIRLPYSDTWPKNEPGTPVDCAPDSDFGAAVVAAHALFLESMSPELIPEIALDTPARQLRIDRHSGKYDPAELNGTCTVLGWDKPQPGSSVWLIFHQCGDANSSVDVTPVRMQNDTGEWLMVYNIDGQIIINEAEPNTTYFPFEGGD